MKIFQKCECEDCPLSWEERSYEGDCDCGCLIYGDLYDGSRVICRLPIRIKRIIADVKQRKIDKAMAHQYDGIIEWYEEQQRKECAMQYAINETLKERGIAICFHDETHYYPIGSEHPYGNGYFDASYGEVSEIVGEYEDKLKEAQGKE